VEHSLVAHQAGLHALDARGDLVATCGMVLRGGRVVPENSVHVYDVRGALRPLFSPPFSAGPSLLAWHPSFSTTLLAGSASGLCCMMDVSTSFAHTYQVRRPPRAAVPGDTLALQWRRGQGGCAAGGRHPCRGAGRGAARAPRTGGMHGSGADWPTPSPLPLRRWTPQATR
jgi:hypothetical protein